MLTDAEHRALDERLDIFSWGLALLIIAIIMVIPGISKLWHFLLPFSLIFVGMSVIRKKLKTRRDTEGLILGAAAGVIALLNIFGVDFTLFPLIPVVIAVVGVGLILNALMSARMRSDSRRQPEE